MLSKHKEKAMQTQNYWDNASAAEWAEWMENENQEQQRQWDDQE